VENLDEIRATAQRFRVALEGTGPFNLHGLRTFPAGACGDSCRLLAEYLRAAGLGEFGIVTGWRRPQMITHAWLVQGDVIVDITADQFVEVDTPLIVTTRSDWHDRWDAGSPSWRDVGLSYYHKSAGAAADFARLAAAGASHLA